jgi:glycosyltransferase involved in cell wall biosynthesis
MRVLTITPALPSESEPGSMAPAARQIQSLVDLGVTMHVQEVRGLPKLKYLQAVPRLRRQLNEYDLIHAHYGYCGWLARFQLKRPIVVSFMGDDLLGTPKADGSLELVSRCMISVNRRLAKWVNQVIVKSAEMADVVRPVQAHVIPNGVDTEEFHPQDLLQTRRELGWDPLRTYVLFPGNAKNPRKGFALAEAATKVAETILGRSIDIIRLWDVDPKQVPLYMNACNAMWMVSMIEGSPNVVKEAMACNLPVVSVPVGDTVQQLGGVEGNCIAARDPDALGRAMAEILSTAQPSQGRQAILSRGLDMQCVARRILHVYEMAIGQSTKIHATARYRSTRVATVGEG